MYVHLTAFDLISLDFLAYAVGERFLPPESGHPGKFCLRPEPTARLNETRTQDTYLTACHLQLQAVLERYPFACWLES